jgi:uncharacterized Zn finger protein
VSYYGFKPYVPAAKRRAIAAREVERLRKKGRKILPVVVEARTIARTFWGKAWCENLERYSDFENRLPRGRTYVRNGSIVDLQIECGQVRAIVSGSELYTVRIDIDAIPKARWGAICADCLGSVTSLVELLQGKISKNVMERVCREGDGLFPSPREIKMRCSCPDWADMCKHASAVLYGVGARFDAEPDFLFALRGVDRSELIAGAERNLPIGQTQVDAARIVAEDDVAALFGIELAPAPSQSGSEDADTVLKSGPRGGIERPRPFNRPQAKEPISLNSNSSRTKPTPTRSKDSKASPVSSGARPQPIDDDANRAEAQIAKGKGNPATPPIRSPGKAPKQDVAAREPIAPPLEPKSLGGAQTIAAKWTKSKKQKARYS